MIKIIILNKKTGGFNLWISGEQSFVWDAFVRLMEPLEIVKVERILESFGPAEIVDDYHTVHGVFRAHHEFDEYAGTTISSKEHELIERILSMMLASGEYQLK